MSNRVGRQAQRGAAMVETALTMSLFLLLIFAIIEFALLMFTWTRGVEATRVAAREAIVTDPVTAGGDLCDLAKDCSSSVAVTCSGGSCGKIFERAQAFLPRLTESQLSVTYNCSDVGFDGRPDELLIPEVTIEISGYNHEMVVPSLIGMPKQWPLPAMTTTRTGEDLHTTGTAFDACD